MSKTRKETFCSLENVEKSKVTSEAKGWNYLGGGGGAPGFLIPVVS